jgi:hypothetical protein
MVNNESHQTITKPFSASTMERGSVDPIECFQEFEFARPNLKHTKRESKFASRVKLLPQYEVASTVIAGLRRMVPQ